MAVGTVTLLISFKLPRRMFMVLAVVVGRWLMLWEGVKHSNSVEMEDLRSENDGIVH